MRKLFLLFTLLTSLTWAQSAVRFLGQPGAVPINVPSNGTLNATATAAGPVTSLAVTITALNLSVIDPAVIQCWSGTTTRTPIAITNFTTTGSAPITTVTPTFSSSSNVTCEVNASGGAGATGAAGAAGATGATGAGGGPGVAPYSTTTVTGSPMTITAATHGQGTKAFGLCWDASTNPQVEESCNWSRDPATGDLTLTYSVAPAQIDIFGATGGFANPMSTPGDIIYGGTAGAATRLGIGGANTLLHGGASAPAYSAVVNGDIANSTIDLTAKVANLLPLANGGTNCAAPFVTNPQTTTYQVLAADFTCFKTITVASGTFTITLVASGSQPAAGLFINIINYGSGVVTIARSGQNINGAAANIVLESGSAANPTSAFVRSDAINYFADIGFGNPMTTAGDIVIGGTTGLPTRTACATANTVLRGGAPPACSSILAADLPATLSAGTAITSAALTTAVITTDIHCVSAGGCTLGTAALPASSAYIGGSATNNWQFTGTATGARSLTPSETARSVMSNNTATAAGNIAMNTTVDVLAYQTAEIPAYVFVTASFTTSGSGTALEAITGLTWTMPGSTALNVPFHCALVYHQNTAAAAVAFGFQNATTGPTNLLTSGVIYTSATVFAAANVANTTATTATSVVSGTPSVITTNWNATLDGLIEQPSGTASVFTIRVSTATAADTVTVLRGSYCRVG